MGLLDSAFPLPSIGNTSSDLSSALSFSVADTTTKLTETANSVDSTFGNADAFTKLGASLPSVGSLSSLLSSTSTTDGMVSATQAKASTGAQTISTDHMVTLTENAASVVMFDVMPEITESRTVEYEAVAPAQSPGAFQKFRGSSSTQWTINATFISRTTLEARANLLRLNLLRGWSQPFYGDAVTQQFPGKLGAPPPVLTLKGFRKYIIGPVPVVITSLNWSWPKDVDWLPTDLKGDDGNPVPFPSVMTVSIQCVESYSAAQFNQFDLNSFRNGDMVGAYSGGSTTINTVSQTTNTTSSTVSQTDYEAANRDRRLRENSAITPTITSPDLQSDNTVTEVYIE